ncbi:unnamed protein product [Urochloa humidicola]
MWQSASLDPLGFFLLFPHPIVLASGDEQPELLVHPESGAISVWSGSKPASTGTRTAHESAPDNCFPAKPPHKRGSAMRASSR